MSIDEEGFRAHMKKKQKTPSTIEASIEGARGFSEFLRSRGKTIEEAKDEDLDDYVGNVLEKDKVAKQMWALRYYFGFIGNAGLLKAAGGIREQHTSKRRQPFKLRDFMNVSPDSLQRLEAVGVSNVDQMISKCRTHNQREELSKRTGVSVGELLELAKLSNLSRLGAVKSVRARLYYDAGIDTIQKMSELSGEELRRITAEHIERTGFDGIPPTPKEAEGTVRAAKKLDDAIEF